MSNIRLNFVIEAPVHEVYKAITEQTGVEGWWTTDVTLKAEENFPARFGFGDEGEMNFKVVSLKADTHIRWDTVSAPPPDWSGTHVTFDLKAVEQGTRLDFAHRDFPTEDGSYAYCTYQWAYFLESLKSYVETGQGKPAMA